MDAVSRKTVAAEEGWPRLTWSSAPGNAGEASFLWVEISAAAGMNCRRFRVSPRESLPDFIEIFALA
jgi:hypothetical protein